jgi:septal ring factor EnvC (AmiA/AmiB activator)
MAKAKSNTEEPKLSRLERLQQEIAAEEAKQAGKVGAAIEKLTDKRDKLVTRIRALDDQLIAVEAELDEYEQKGYTVPSLPADGNVAVEETAASEEE